MRFYFGKRLGKVLYVGTSLSAKELGGMIAGLIVIAIAVGLIYLIITHWLMALVIAVGVLVFIILKAKADVDKAEVDEEASRISADREAGYDGSIEPANASASAFVQALPTLIKCRPESSSSVEGWKVISDLVADAFNRAASLHGFAVLEVRDSGNRYVQYGAPAVLETVGRAYIDSGNPLTPEQLDRLTALGWPQTEDEGGGNFVYPGTKQASLEELTEVAVRTLVEVHGARSPEDLSITVDQ